MEAGKEQVSLRRMFELELELDRLCREHGIQRKSSWWIRVGDWLADHIREPRKVNRRKYLTLALSCGWFCGTHQFYTGRRLLGWIYLLFCWTGIPLAMTVIDVLLVLLQHEPDEDGMILL